MKLPARSAAWLLPFLLTGCFELPFHKAKPAPANALAPYLRSSHTLELVEIELPPEDTVIAAYAVYNMGEQTEPIRQPVRRRRPQGTEETTIAPDAPPANPEVSAIGQLTSGEPASSLQQMEDSIAGIERRLNGINRPLSDSEQKTANHIREFLKQARAALASGDVEGAHTLAGKAQVLLTELTK